MKPKINPSANLPLDGSECYEGEGRPTDSYTDPVDQKIRDEHALRDLTERWYWKGYNDALDKASEMLNAAYNFGDDHADHD